MIVWQLFMEIKILDQNSEERLDAYRNHFMEEVSAIAGAMMMSLTINLGLPKSQGIRTMI